MAYTIDPAGFPPRHAVLMGPNGTEMGVAIISQTPTTSASPDYAAGEVIGGKLTFAGAALAAGGASLLQAVTVNSKVANTAAMDLVLFNDNPTNSTFTDNDALAVNALDFPAVIGVVHITDWTSLGTQATGQAKNEALPMTLVGTALYGVLVARGAVNLGTTSDITVTVRTIRQ